MAPGTDVSDLQVDAVPLLRGKWSIRNHDPRMWIKKPREALKLRNALMKQSHQDALAEAEEAYRQ